MYAIVCASHTHPHTHTHTHTHTSHSGRIVNFKINNSNGQYYITPKVKFHSIQELVSKYHSSPIRSKQRGDQNIMLLRPIPVDPNLEQVAMETMKQQQQLQQQQQEAREEGWGGVERRGGGERVAEEGIREGRTG